MLYVHSLPATQPGQHLPCQHGGTQAVSNCSMKYIGSTSLMDFSLLQNKNPLNANVKFDVTMLRHALIPP